MKGHGVCLCGGGGGGCVGAMFATQEGFGSLEEAALESTQVISN